VYHYLAWASAVAPRRRTLQVAAVAGLFYLGFMTKFVAALFLPVIAVVTGLLLPAHRRRLREDWPRWLIAAAAVAAAVAPWFLYQTRYTVEGREVWGIMFGDHVYTRFTEYADPRHVAPWHFYLSTGWRELSQAGSAIWVAFGLLVLVAHTTRRRLPEGMVILCWLVLPVTLMSFGTSKLYHYAYPYLPPLALAAGYGVAWLAGLLATTLRNVTRPGLLKPARWSHPAFLLLAYGAAALALAIRPIEIEVAGRELFRNHSVLRPAVAAIGLAWLAGRTPLAFGGGLVLVASLLVPTPFEGAGASLGRLLETRAPLKTLGECLREVDATRRAHGAVVAEPYAPVSAEAFLHPYFYYLRGSGWHWPVDDAVLQRALFEPGHDRPVIIDLPRYNAFVERVRPAGPHPAAVSRPGIVVFLPGDYADCRFPPELRPR
jgi:4-amino-4-deoxy-L-arabinose transferase-like glycosyltransferase